METPQDRFSRWLDRFLDSYYRPPARQRHLHRRPRLRPQASRPVRIRRGRVRLGDDAASERLGCPAAGNPVGSPEDGPSDWPSWVSGDSAVGVPVHPLPPGQSFITMRARPFSACYRCFAVPSLPSDERLKSATERMNGIEVLLQQARENIDTAPSAWTERAIRECDGALAFLETGLSQLLRDNDIESNEADDAAGRAADAFRQFKHWLQSDLAQRPNNAYGCGETAFKLMLQKGHCLDMDPADVEAYAWEQMRESQEEVGSGSRATSEPPTGVKPLPSLARPLPDPGPLLPPPLRPVAGLPRHGGAERPRHLARMRHPVHSHAPNGHGALHPISTSSPTIPPQPSTKSPQSTACWPLSTGAPPQRSACGCSKPPTTASSS